MGKKTLVIFLIFISNQAITGLHFCLFYRTVKFIFSLLKIRNYCFQISGKRLLKSSQSFKFEKCGKNNPIFLHWDGEKVRCSSILIITMWRHRAQEVNLGVKARLYWCGHLQAVSATLWLRWDTFTRTTQSCGGKGTARPLSQAESAPFLALTGFYCFSGHITLRMVLVYYAQVRFRWLPFTEDKGGDVANYIKKEGYLQM